jgi:hypothetical protein
MIRDGKEALQIMLPEPLKTALEAEAKRRMLPLSTTARVILSEALGLIRPLAFDPYEIARMTQLEDA